MENIIDAGSGFYLRPLKETDTFMLKPLLEDDESVTYFTERNYKNFHDTKSLVLWLCESGEYYLLVHERDGAVAGIAGLRPVKERAGVKRLAYMLGKKYRGKGIMPDVIDSVTKHAFEDPGTEVIEAAIRPDNIKSLRCIEKAGYEFDRIVDREDDELKSRKLIYLKRKNED
ncbi:MAG: GNAT family N-acetyltransferase [Lachnospiraceae bacterium]|nr:GNAT family N-acetyltransferase [Lachnospiraceae bacterium]MBP5184893.1 GNAT family N-acetyltransferase [Lachnospiraceae bacterium]